MTALRSGGSVQQGIMQADPLSRQGPGFAVKILITGNSPEASTLNLSVFRVVGYSGGQVCRQLLLIKAHRGLTDTSWYSSFIR